MGAGSVCLMPHEKEERDTSQHSRGKLSGTGIEMGVRTPGSGRGRKRHEVAEPWLCQAKGKVCRGNQVSQEKRTETNSVWKCHDEI